jgi:hypothetical protein
MKRLATRLACTTMLVGTETLADCVPVDPETGEVCVKLIENIRDGVFTNLRWQNNCKYGIEVNWSADNGRGGQTVPAHDTVHDQCYPDCGAVSWHAECKPGHAGRREKGREQQSGRPDTSAHESSARCKAIWDRENAEHLAVYGQCVTVADCSIAS